MATRIYLDEEVLRIQNEVRRYYEQRIYDGDIADQMQRRDGSGADSDTLSGEPRRNFLQDAPTAPKRQ